MGLEGGPGEDLEDGLKEDPDMCVQKCVNMRVKQCAKHVCERVRGEECDFASNSGLKTMPIIFTHFSPTCLAHAFTYYFTHLFYELFKALFRPSFR